MVDRLCLAQRSQEARRVLGRWCRLWSSQSSWYECTFVNNVDYLLYMHNGIWSCTSFSADACCADVISTWKYHTHSVLGSQIYAMILKKFTAFRGIYNCNFSFKLLWHLKATSAVYRTRSSVTAKSTAHLSCLVSVLYDISRDKICDD